MGSDVVVHAPPGGLATPSLPEMMKLAETFKDSGMFTDVASVAAAFVKIQAGAEMGVQPFAAMNGIHIIKGKPVVGAGLLAGLLDAHPAYSYRVAWSLDSDGHEEACSVTIAKNGTEKGTATFSLHDANRAGLMSNTSWIKWPANMLFARAMSNAVRWYAGGVTNGSPVYVEGEVEELEAVDLGELAKKPSEVPLNRTRATRDEKNQVGEALTAAGLTAAEGRLVLEDVAGVEKRDDLYSDDVPKVIEAILAEGERRRAEAAGLDDIAAVIGEAPEDVPDGQQEMLS